MGALMERTRIHLRKGDTVEVIGGKFSGRRGKVLDVLTDRGRVIVEGVNLVAVDRAQGWWNARRIVDFHELLGLFFQHAGDALALIGGNVDLLEAFRDRVVGFRDIF